MNKCLFPDSAAPAEEIITPAACCCCLPVVPSRWEHPLSTLLQMSWRAQQAGTRWVWKQTLLIVSQRGVPMGAAPCQGCRSKRGDRRTLTRCRMTGDSCHLTATGGSVTVHKKLCPNDKNSRSCLPRFESRLNCHNGNTEPAYTVLVPGALWGLALERERIASEGVGQDNPRVVANVPIWWHVNPPGGP